MMHSGARSRNRTGLLLLAAATVWAVAVSAAGEKAKLVYKATNGAVARYKTDSSIQVEAAGQKLTLETKDIEKVTYNVLPSGDMTALRETESSQATINGQMLPEEPDTDKTTVTFKADGTLVSVTTTGEASGSTLSTHLYPATNIIFTDSEVSVGSKWSREFKLDEPKGLKAGKADYEVVAFEKAANVDCVRIKLSFKETDPNKPVTGTGVALVELATGDTVIGDFTIENLPFPGPGGAPANATAKLKQERTGGSPVGGKVEPAKDKTIDEVVKDYQKLPGLLTLYRKKEAGKDTVYAEIKEDQLDKLFFLQATAATGNAESIVAGDPLNDVLFKFSRGQDDRIIMVVPNIAFQAAGDKPIAKAVKRNFPEGWIDSWKIDAKQPDRKSLLINISNLFAGDTIAQVGRLLGSGGLLGIGGGGGGFALDREKSYVAEYKVFPDNIYVQSAYHFMRAGGPAGTLADPRSIPIKVNYNLFSVHDNGFKPRLADPRVGYFNVEFQDFTDDGKDTQMVRYILRWDIQKADPAAAVSAPKKPIVFWIDNAIPTEYRGAVREGLLMWNKAFLTIGIKDAIEVKQMPDDADFDHADMRYNVIRWSTTQDPPYGAIALFRVNPLTGQIMNAGITIDATLTRGAKLEKRRLIDPAVHFEPAPQPKGRAKKLFDLHGAKCELGQAALDQSWFGYTALDMLSVPGQKPDELKYTNEFLRSIVAHEFGHILGLYHNFAASTQFSLAQLRDGSKVSNYGVIGSVMDYVPFNISAIKNSNTSWWTKTLGRYDVWAVQYGYSNIAGKTPQDEWTKLQSIASRGNEPGLAYHNDLLADQFDPAVQRWDLSAEPLDFQARQMQVTRYMLMNLDKQEPKKGRSYYDFTRAFNGLMNVYASSANSISRYVGGVHVNHNHRGDKGEKPVLLPVAAEKQKKALQVLNSYLFAENAFNFPKSYYSKFTANPFSISFGGSQDFPMRDQFANLQRSALRRLFSPGVLTRISNNEFKAATASEVLTLPSLFSSVGDSVWSEVAARRNVDTLRRQLQRNHIDVLSDMVLTSTTSGPQDAKMLAWNQLRTIKNRIQAAQRVSHDEYTRIHLDELLLRVNRALNAQQTIGGAAPSSSNLLQLLLGGQDGEDEAPAAK